MCRGKDLISRLLVVDPGRRLTADQALSHKWLHSGVREAVHLEPALENMRTLPIRLRVAVASVIAAGRLSATLSRISDGLQGWPTDNRLPSMTSNGMPRLRGTGSIVPTSVASDAASVSAICGVDVQTRGKQLMVEGMLGVIDAGLDTVEEGMSHNGSAAGGVLEGKM